MNLSKESWRSNVLFLINLLQDFKMMNQVLIEQRWVFNKIQ